MSIHTDGSELSKVHLTSAMVLMRKYYPKVTAKVEISEYDSPQIGVTYYYRSVPNRNRELLIARLIISMNGNSAFIERENWCRESQGLITEMSAHYYKELYGSTAGIITTKRCPHCETSKHVRNFAPAPARPDGLSGWCKACMYPSIERYRTKQKESKQ